MINEQSLAKFKLESRFLDFLSGFNSGELNPKLIEILRQFFYAGAADVLLFLVEPPEGMTPERCYDELEEMYAEAIAYAKIMVNEKTGV